MFYYFVCIDVKENNIYDIMAGGPNFLGHSFVVKTDFGEDELTSYLINLMNEEKISFIRSVRVYETFDDEEAVTMDEVKDLLRKGIE